MNRIAKARYSKSALTRLSSPWASSGGVLRRGVTNLSPLSSSFQHHQNAVSFFSTTTINGNQSLSSFAEPDPTLFCGNRLNVKSDVTSSADDPDKQLRADVKAMGSILGSTISRYEGEDVLNKVESLRLSAKVR